jgi:hypothetical protein
MEFLQDTNIKKWNMYDLYGMHYFNAKDLPSLMYKFHIAFKQY